jgi:hypothetical protein
MYKLRCMTSFFSRHFVTYKCQHGGNTWHRRDDAAPPEHGLTWLNILQKSFLGCQQPKVLVYEAMLPADDVRAHAAPNHSCPSIAPVPPSDMPLIGPEPDGWQQVPGKYTQARATQHGTQGGRENVGGSAQARGPQPGRRGGKQNLHASAQAGAASHGGRGAQQVPGRGAQAPRGRGRGQPTSTGSAQAPASRQGGREGHAGGYAQTRAVTQSGQEGQQNAGGYAQAQAAPQSGRGVQRKSGGSRPAAGGRTGRTREPT